MTPFTAADLRIFSSRSISSSSSVMVPSMRTLAMWSTARAAEFVAGQPHPAARRWPAPATTRAASAPEGQLAPQAAAVDEFVGSQGHGCLACIWRTTLKSEIALRTRSCANSRQRRAFLEHPHGCQALWLEASLLEHGWLIGYRFVRSATAARCHNTGEAAGTKLKNTILACEQAAGTAMISQGFANRRRRGIEVGSTEPVQRLATRGYCRQRLAATSGEDGNRANH